MGHDYLSRKSVEMRTSWAGTVWHTAAWYAYCLGFIRDERAARLETAMFNYACAEGIVFG